MRVPAFALRKAADLVTTVFVVSLTVFVLFQLIPGDPAAVIAGANAGPGQIAAVKKNLGLDRSLFLQYVFWLKGLFCFDLGTSIQYGVPVGVLLADRLAVTAALAFESLVLAFCISVPAGLCAAYFRGKCADWLLSRLGALFLSLPHYFLGILFVWLFGLVFHLFMPGSFVHYTESAAGFALWLVIPALALALPNCGILIKIIRTALTGQLDAPYVRTARSKGCSRKRILFTHVLRNALRPVLTVSGIIAADVFSGSIVVEQVFGIPGMGRLLIGGISRRDFPLVMGITVYTSAVIVLVNSLAETIMYAADRRCRLG